MNTSRAGFFMAPIAQRMARTRYLGNPILLVSLLITGLLLMSCGAPENGSSSQGSSGRVHIVGSTALLPLATKAVALFHQQNPEVQIDAQGGGSLTGLDAVANHQADIGDSDIYADPALYPDPNLTDHLVCVNVFTLIVNPQIPITSLSTQQIINIFTGVTKNWKDVGGPDLPISPVIRPPSSGTRALFDKYVLSGAAQVGAPLTSDYSTTVLNNVAQTPGAIGYTTVTVLNPTVKAISLNGVSATKENVQNGTYTFWGFEHMYTMQNGVNATTSFMNFMQTPQVQQLAQQLGYISVSAIKA